jgi:Protein of unknown function (DUF1360)
VPGAGLATRFGLAVLATWRLAHLVTAEDGPGNAITRLRAKAGTGQIGELMDCFYCLSLWVAAPLAFVVSPRRRDTPIVWLALSGAACLVERTTRERGAWDVLWEEPARGGASGRGSDTADAREPGRSADEAPQAATQR